MAERSGRVPVCSEGARRGASVMHQCRVGGGSTGVMEARSMRSGGCRERVSPSDVRRTIILQRHRYNRNIGVRQNGNNRLFGDIDSAGEK